MAEKEMPNSKWIGPPVCQAEGRALYKSCEIESGDIVCLGDYVYMLPQDPTLGLFIARIESLFEADEAKYAKVRWLYRQTDLKHNPPSVPREDEIFYTNYFDCQLIQSIMGPCKVVTDFTTKPIGGKSQGNSTEVHVCRYCYCEESGVFVAMLPEEIDYQYLLASDNPRELADEDASADAKDLAHMLVQIERRMPPETSTALWQVRRMAWMRNVKAVTNLEEVKEALLELEDGYGVFPNQTSWQESIHAVESSDSLLQYINGFSYEMRIKAGASINGKPEANSLNKSRPSNSYRKKHKRKRGPLLPTSSPNSEKQAFQDTFICKSIYEIEQRSLPQNAPQQLKNLRAALVNDTTTEFVTISYPSMASLAEYFEEVNLSRDDASQERKITKCLFDQLSTSTCTMPRFDEEFSMTHETAQRVLKGLVTSTDYLQQGHRESFWLLPGLDATCRKTEAQASEDEKSLKVKDIASSPPNQDTTKKHRPSEKDSPRVYRHKKFNKVKMQASSDKNEKFSESESSGEQNEHNHNSTPAREMPPSSDDPDCKDAPPLQHTVGSKPGSNFTVVCKKKSQNLDASKEYQGTIRWGVRKKITTRCRVNTFSDDSRDKGLFCNKDVHKQDQHKVEKTGHESNAFKHNAVTKVFTRIGKGTMLKVPKLMEGRWSTERYKAAQLKLFEIMKDKGAVPGKPLLRPALRVEARKHIGDTGLLDHLLKHMTDTVINDGERFRRRHNSEGAMEYWLEDARLQELRRQAGVDHYWIPPPGWKIGDIITNSKSESMSLSQMNELKQLREEVEKLKSQLRYVCLHVGASLIDSKNTSNLNSNSDFQSWKEIMESITKLQEIKEERHGFQEMCHGRHSQRSSIAKHSMAEMDRVTSCRTTPTEHDCLKELDSGDNHTLPPTQDSHLTGTLQANTVADEHETHEMRKAGVGQADDQAENKSGDEITLFYKAAQRGSLKKTGEVLSKAKQGNSEKKGSGSTTILRRSPRTEMTKEADDKENVVPMMQQCERMKAFQGWKKTQGFTQREVLSAKFANVTSSLSS